MKTTTPTPKLKSGTVLYIIASAIAGVIGILLVDEDFIAMIGSAGFVVLYLLDKTIQYHLRTTTTTPLETESQRHKRNNREKTQHQKNLDLLNGHQSDDDFTKNI